MCIRDRFWTWVDWAFGGRKEMASFFSTDINLVEAPPASPMMTTHTTRTTHLERLPQMKPITVEVLLPCGRWVVGGWSVPGNVSWVMRSSDCLPARRPARNCLLYTSA